MPSTTPMPSTSFAPRRALAVYAAVLLGVCASAQAQPAKPGTGSLTRDELRACMDRQDENDRRGAAYERAIKSVNQNGEAVSREGNELAAAQSKVDTKSAAAVNAFKQRIADYEGRAAAYESRVKELQQESNELQAFAKAHKTQCSTRPYLSFDHDAVMAERAARPVAASAPVPAASVASAPPAKKKR